MIPTSEAILTLSRRALAALLVFLLGAGTAGASAEFPTGGMTQIDPPTIDLPGEETEPATAIMTEMDHGLVWCGRASVWQSHAASGIPRDSADPGETTRDGGDGGESTNGTMTEQDSGEPAQPEDADASASEGDPAPDGDDAAETAQEEDQVSQANDPRPGSPAGLDSPGTCWQVGVGTGVASWDQVNDTAAGDRATFQMQAPGAPVSSTTDDTTAFGEVSLGAEFGDLAIPIADGVAVPGATATLRQSGDFEAATTVRSGNRAVRSISTFEPGPALGVGFGATYYRGAWSVTPYASLMRQNIDVEIRSQRLLNGEVVDQDESEKSIEDTFACFGVTAGLNTGRPLLKSLKRSEPGGLALGLRAEWCELNDATYSSFGLTAAVAF